MNSKPAKVAGKREMARSHIKIAQSTLSAALRKAKNEKLPTILQKGNYRFHIIEVPNVSLDYYNMVKKDAVHLACKAARECTFRVESIPDRRYLPF